MLLILCGFGVLPIQQAALAVTFDASYAITSADADTNSDTLVDVTGLSVTLPSYSGDVLMISSYSANKKNNSDELTARHQLDANGSPVGIERDRHIIKSSAAAGAGAAIGVVNVSSGGSMTLQHAKSTGDKPGLSTLSHSTLTAIPLTSGGKTLSHAYTSSTDTVTSNVEEVAKTTALNVANIHGGTAEVFIMATFETVSSGTSNASWQLEYRTAETGLWEVAGNASSRKLDTNQGVAAVTALADLDAAGDYEFRLTQSLVSGDNFSTLDVDLVALSLSIDADTYLQSYEQYTVGSTGATLDLAVSEDMDVFVAASVTATSTSSTTGEYQLFLDGGTTSSIVAGSTREVDTGDVGSVALTGVYSLLASDTNTLTLQTDDADLTFGTDGNNVVGFGLTAVPEPSQYTLIFCVLTFAVVLRRRRPNR
ncbi:MULTISPECIES: hypothetical protein [unclassified Lentimonas]|uniref:hypothetical protein n=1 Tax=unclassified Lentimonas TaxID=2630993 RepID=UPI0013896BEE|nr:MULTISPECIES: hypothetical protein [unclassified Lentimonas]